MSPSRWNETIAARSEETLSTRLVEPYVIERQLPYWYVHTWDRTRDAQR